MLLLWASAYEPQFWGPENWVTVWPLPYDESMSEEEVALLWYVTVAWMK